ncbi:hypothetical protein Moror_5761 [Moniliophthora roreri MCA 2997]|uniref:F-box domain-containing protein n=1 Tax=Moniliophthora roreri (strain MCA 2997) TaxID=1381753 RepID=V2X3D5_MONRO|nr:hypothetical protein Moror_5761 [Moniliophthora roreri MCA 2997]
MNLPLEVWEDVIDQCSRSDMVKLTRVSSTFRKMATRILYQLVWLHINERKTIRCLKTLCSNALAAQSVKALYLVDMGFKPHLRAFLSLVIRAFSALPNLKALQYTCCGLRTQVNGSIAPPAIAQIVLHCTFPGSSLESISVPGFVGPALLKRHQSTLREIGITSEVFTHLDTQIFGNEYNFPVLKSVSLSNKDLLSFLSKSRLPSLSSIGLPQVVSAEDLDRIKSVFSDSRSGTRLLFWMVSLDIRVFDMIADKLPHLTSLTIGCSSWDNNLKTIRPIAPKLSRLQGLQDFTWNRGLLGRTERA